MSAKNFERLFDREVIQKYQLDDNRFGEELMEEVSDFPAGEHDDLVDATTLALARFRAGGFLQLSTDMDDEPSYYPAQRVYY